MPLLSQLPGGERRAFICTHISRQSSRTFYRSRSSTSGTCSGIAPPLCPCRGCSLCRSTSSHSCRSRWRSCCIAWKKEKAVSKRKALQGFPNQRPAVVLGPDSSARRWVKPARLHLSCSRHMAGVSTQPSSPLHLQGRQEEPQGCTHITCSDAQDCTCITCSDTQNNIKLLL